MTFFFFLILGFPNIRGTFLGVPSPKSEDYSILGSILGSPFLGGKLPYTVVQISGSCN